MAAAAEVEAEVRVLRKLRHPNIVRYVDSFMDNRKLHIVMEAATGGDLKARVDKARGVLMKEDQIVDWFIQITLSLKHIHDRKLLHRDLKPANIFLDSKARCKVGDFGLSRVMEGTFSFAQTNVGTPYYLAPEICK